MTRPPDVSGVWDDVHLVDPARVYVVATTPRTGSTWLCETLRDTHQLGVPCEYFNEVTLTQFCDRLGVPRPRPRARLLQWQNRMHHQPLSGQVTAWRTVGSTRSYVRWLMTHRTSANGTFGTKLHYDELRQLRLCTGLDVFDLLSPRRAVWLRRRDSVRQAISFYRALATLRWHTTDAATDRAEPAFDAAAIQDTVADLRAQDAAWHEELTGRGIPIHQIYYEDLVDDRDAVLSDCFAFLGAPGAAIPPSTLGRLSDDLTEEWVERLRAAR